jgi:hypothetical protein
VLVSVFVGYQKIRGGDIVAHREWMLRSYALIFAAVTLRLWREGCGDSGSGVLHAS